MAIKKILFTIIITFIFISSVNASTNRLHFSKTNNELTYDTTEFDKRLFMYHVDMLPGKKYQDELIIENDSHTSYSLYLRIKENEVDIDAKELLENIIMIIYLDDKILYEGYALGIDYVYNNQLVLDSIYIGNYIPGASSLLTVETKLKEDYSNIDNTSLAKIDWQFIAISDTKQEVINPNTKDNINKILKIIGISFIILLYGLYKLRELNKI